MATLKDSLARYYTLVNRERKEKKEQPLTKAQFMRRVFPGRYKNDASAYAAYQRIQSGQRQGGELVPLIEPERRALHRGERVPRMYQAGQWKTIIHFNFIDSDGNLVEDQEISFNMESAQHFNLLAVPYLEEAILPIAEEYLREKAEQSFESAQLTYIEVIPINVSRAPAVDLDRLYI